MDGPVLIEWRVHDVILTSVVGRGPDAPEFAKSSQERAILKPWIPRGATGWRLTGETAWKPLGTFPACYGISRRASDTLPMDLEEETEE
jgi:hypothetical protein